MTRKRGGPMPIASFEDFSQSMCELLAIEPPPMESNSDGDTGFVVNYQGVDISFIKGRQNQEADLLMVIDFGIPPADKEADVLKDVMEANCVMRGVGAPCFMRHPADGMIALRYSFLCQQVDVRHVYEAIVAAADAVESWREQYFGSDNGGRESAIPAAPSLSSFV